MLKLRTIIVLLSLAAILTVTACSTILIGSGEVITETVQVSNFDHISLEGSGEARVTQDGTEALKVETHENMIEHVMVEVDGGTLTVGIKEDVNLIFPRRLIFHVSVDDIASLAVAGSGGVEAETISADQMEVSVAGSGEVRISDLVADMVNARISGSGEIDLAGEAEAQEVRISGSGEYQAGDVCSAAVMVRLSGSGQATVCANETLEADISGSGSVDYYGQPTANFSGSGSGGLNSLGEK